MKAQIFRKFSVVLMLAAIPFFGGCDEEQANSAPVPAPSSDAVTNQPAPSASLDTNQVAPEETDEQLADAPGKIISTPDTGSTNVSNNPQLNDFVKLVQAGVGESVLMAYVTNSANAFNVTSDDILYLNDLGAPETVVSAMLQRDQHFNGNATAMTAAPQSQSQATYSTPPPAPAQEPVEAPAPPAPYPDTSVAAQAGYGTPPLTPPVEEDVQQAPNASYSYFYDSLSPYGNWVDIQGYGPCWQPTAGAGNPGWQPYCDRGHWAYTDCGWCWVSDYSWGWAPFHYGRWFRHNRFGWCWAPDTVWGPSWVSWRYNNNYCGWAPLPPTACYRPGFGFTYFGRPVGLNFEFNLSANRFLFVSLDHFHDRSPGRFRLDHREVNRIFNTTTINHQIIRGNNHTLINRGIPVERVAAATHTEIHPIHVRADADAPRSSQLGRDGRSLSIFRPALPTPKTAQAPRLVGEGVQRDTHFDLRSHAQQPATVTRTPVATPAPERRPIIPNTVRPSDNQARDNRTPQPSGERPGSLILRGPDRSTVNRDGNPARNDSPNLRRDPGFQGQQNLPADNNRRTLTPTAQQPDRPAPQPLLPPSFNRQDNQMRRDDLQQQQQQRQLLQQQQRDVQQQQQQFQQQQQQQQRALQQQQRESEHQQRYFQQQQQQQPMVPVPRQEAPRSFDMPRGDNNQNFNPGYRSAPAPEVRSAPTMPQFAPPARESRQDSGGGGNGGGQGRGNGGGGGNNGSGNGNGGGNGNGNGRGNR